jgi:methyl-accepting chemotaxis protein
MSLSGFIHHDPTHQRRQLRWVLPPAALLLATVLATLAVQYRISNQAVGTEFFRAHKSITHTGELLRRGSLIGDTVLVGFVVVMAGWMLRVTHRIVRPVHTMHRALDALATGDLGVRVELHCNDEFQEVGEALNKLVDEFSTTLAVVHTGVDRLAALVVARPPHDATVDAQIGALVAGIDRTLDFFRLEPRRTISAHDS